MARYLGLNLYVVPNAVPHLLGAVGATNTKARLQYDKITKYMSQSLNEDVGRSSFLSVKVPPLAIRTVEECRKDPEALGDVIVTMRERHAKLRAGLSDFDAHWTSATSYSDRIRLESDFRHAMEELVKRTTAPKDRWIYKTWSVVSSLDPTKILQRLGDRLVVMGRREAVIGQVRGLDAFWRDMLAAPPASTRAVIKNIVPRQADEPVWAAARGLASAVDKALASGAWKGG